MKKEPTRAMMPCSHGESVDIAWSGVQDFARVHVGVIALHGGADENIANGDLLRPALRSWHFYALHPVGLGRRCFARNTAF